MVTLAHESADGQGRRVTISSREISAVGIRSNSTRMCVGVGVGVGVTSWLGDMSYKETSSSHEGERQLKTRIFMSLSAELYLPSTPSPRPLRSPTLTHQ